MPQRRFFLPTLSMQCTMLSARNLSVYLSIYTYPCFFTATLVRPIVTLLGLLQQNPLILQDNRDHAHPGPSLVYLFIFTTVWKTFPETILPRLYISYSLRSLLVLTLDIVFRSCDKRRMWAGLHMRWCHDASWRWCNVKTVYTLCT